MSVSGRETIGDGCVVRARSARYSAPLIGALILMTLPQWAEAQTVLEEAVVVVDGQVAHRIHDTDVATCLWMSTYNIHGEPAPAGDSIGYVRISFYVRGEPTSGPLSSRDGSDARFHTRVVIGENPTNFYRKAKGPELSFDRKATLSDLGELVLATLDIPTRAGSSGLQTRQFTTEEASRIKELYGSWATCHAAVVEYAAGSG
ncbi:MAG: hypothetical protein RLN75_07375 [Longimicrobiales bacterium]